MKIRPTLYYLYNNYSFYYENIEAEIPQKWERFCNNPSIFFISESQNSVQSLARKWICLKKSSLTLVKKIRPCFLVENKCSLPLFLLKLFSHYIFFRNQPKIQLWPHPSHLTQKRLKIFLIGPPHLTLLRLGGGQSDPQHYIWSRHINTGNGMVTKLGDFS